MMLKRIISFFFFSLLLIPLAKAENKITVYTIGDSTMANKNTDGNPERGWGMMLQLFFDQSQVKVSNHAVNGRSTKSFIDEGRWDKIMEVLKPDDYVIIQFGHNDEKQDNPTLYADAHGAYTNNLTKYIKETQEKGAFPILMTSIVRRHFDESGKLINTHGAYPYAVRTLAKKLKVPMVDMEQKTKSFIQNLGDDESKKLFVWFEPNVYPRFPKGKKDDTHLNVEGAQAIASLAVEGINELKLPLAKYIKPALFERNKQTLIYIDKSAKQVVHEAVNLLKDDVKAVFDADLLVTKNKSKAQIVVASSKELKGKWEAFSIRRQKGNQIVISGSDDRGKAYGILELSRMIGVSPWVWWGDITPEKQFRFAFSDVKETSQSPSVQFRGIFLNDEDWSTLPWADKNFEYSLVDMLKLSDHHRWKGTVGPGAYEKFFQLLLRLRANAMWPAMHECTVPFYFVEGNREMAERYGIVMGASHCEPLMCSAATEWDVRGKGAYNYVDNRDNVMSFWSDRLKNLKKSNNVFTIGMRGKHDGAMEGVKTLQEKTDALQAVIIDQRELLKKYINKDISKVPQQLVPYKEVLEIYENGLEVPEDVMLTWCDDNYGYLTRLSDEEQQKRSGGAGVYYHLSYWGRPHSYLWLCTTQPGLIYNEMMEAYRHNSRRLWIVNVHDPKVASYNLELFLDMAWNVDAVSNNTLVKYLESCLVRDYGKEAAELLLPAMTEFYRLTGMRKPEFMGWSQIELDKRKYNRGMSPVIDTEFSEIEFGNELDRYLGDYQKVKQLVSDAEKLVPENRRAGFYAQIKYPLLGAASMAEKLLYRQKKDLERAIQGYNAIVESTQYYNDVNAGGKWKHSMNYAPQNLPVFEYPEIEKPVMRDSLHDYLQIKPSQHEWIARNAFDYQHSSVKVKTVQMLGHSMEAVQLPKGESLVYEFETQEEGDAVLRTALIPTHANDKGDIRFSVQIDNEAPQVVSIKEPHRSEPWKLNVLRGQALKVTNHKLSKGKHKLTIIALDNHIVVDQWMIDFDTNRKFYLIPINNN